VADLASRIGGVVRARKRAGIYRIHRAPRTTEREMKVGRRMQKKIFTIQRTETVEQAQTLMVVNNIRHLPVLDGKRLVGIISDRDVRGALIPQRVKNSHESREAFFLPRDVTVGETMTADPLFVEPGTDVEEAARLLFNHKIGCLPVLERGQVGGIITDADILWFFIEIMGVLDSSSRVDVTLGSDPHALEKATEIIRKHSGEIISVGILPTRKGRQKTYSFRLKSCDTEPIIAGLRKAGFKVQDEMG
jgi:acetoin utilization protein AcuB